MSSIKWNTLLTIRDWAAALEKLLEQAREAVTGNNAEARQAVQQQLIEYTKNSPAMCNALDDIASQASTDLFVAQVDACLVAIGARNAELKKAIALIEGATDHALKDARTIQLGNLVESLRKTRGALAAFKTLERKLAAPDQNLLAKVKAVEEAIAELMRLT